MTTAQAEPQSSSAGPTVLIVDDEAATRMLLHKIIAGIYPTAVIWEAVDGEAALRLAGTKHPDLVLLDIVLPGSDTSGVLVCQELCKRHTKVLIVSGNATGTILNACLTAGAADVLKKPFSIEEARAKLQACLEG